MGHALAVLLHSMIHHALGVFVSPHRMIMVLAVMVFAAVLMAFSPRSAVAEKSVSSMSIRAHILPRIQFTVDRELVTIKANVDWRASGQVPNGSAVEVLGNGVSTIQFPDGTKGITVLAD